MYTRPSQVTAANMRLERQAQREQRAYDVMGAWACFALGACAATFAITLTLMLEKAYDTGGWHGETYRAPVAGHVMSPLQRTGHVL